MAGLTEPVTAPTTTAAIDTGVLAYFDLGAQGDIGYAKNYNSNQRPGRHVHQALERDRRGVHADVHHQRRVPGVPVHAQRRAPPCGRASTPAGNSSCSSPGCPTARRCRSARRAPFFVDTSSDRAVIYLEGRDPVNRTTSLLFRPLTADGSAVGGNPIYVSSGVGRLRVHRAPLPARWSTPSTPAAPKTAFTSGPAPETRRSRRGVGFAGLGLRASDLGPPSVGRGHERLPRLSRCFLRRSEARGPRSQAPSLPSTLDLSMAKPGSLGRRGGGRGG